jgi:hypothetical protein
MTATNIMGPEAMEALTQAGFPLMEPAQIADAVLTIVTGDDTGRCWICQPGREAEPYQFRGVPGPRGEGEGMTPPSFWDNA